MDEKNIIDGGKAIGYNQKKDLCENEGYPDFLKRAAEKIYHFARSPEVSKMNEWEHGWAKGMISALNIIRREKEEDELLKKQEE
ncbi:MAG: hypothetical protein IKF80_04125 [Erysipelotrichaceae bacterium]|nr:hypothetical protein [Erysipelotrichaceae bacterium]